MLSTAQIQKRLYDVNALRDIGVEEDIILAKQDILYWCLDGEKTEQDLLTKIKRIEEELLAVPDIYNMQNKKRKAKIEELNFVLKEEE